MREQLEYERTSRRKPRAKAYLTYDDDRLAGWAMLFPRGRGWELHIYVKHRWRRNGIGASLRSRALRGAGADPVYVHSWSPASSALYRGTIERGRARNIHVD